MRLHLLFIALLMLCAVSSFTQTAIQTSFESAQGYSAANLHNQNGWTVTSGSAVVTTTKFKTGTQALNLTASNTALRTDYVAYTGTVPGITGEVYADIWVLPTSFVARNFAINGYDLYGGSSRRIFVVEFTPDNKIRAFNGSSSSTTQVGSWVSNQWIRVSVKVDFATEKYQVAIDGNLYATQLNFRETYTPTASGTRQAGVKEFHSLRFNHVTDTDLGTTEVAVDDVYVGTTPIADVSFGASSTTRTITITQPAYGTITLNPATGPYTLNQNVTATLTLPQGYMNNGWTGDLSGTDLVKNFTVTGNMAFSANVSVDPNNPPTQHTITITQPANGTITLSPIATNNIYYKETQVTATVSFEACYQFNGWTGALSGTQLTKTFTVQNDMTIGADIVMNTTPSVKRVVTNVTNFKAALTAMNPGDTIEVANGNYNMSAYTINRSGCEAKPILIIAQNKGQAILDGQTALIFKNMKYTTFKGFAFQSTGVASPIKLENCSKFRITGNAFAINETSSCTWITIGDTYASPEPLRSGYNRVDHNSFVGKTQAGNFIRMDGNIDTQSQYDTIDHNLFRNNGPRATNEKESIRIGVSTLSKSSGFTIVEYNLFEDCDGDPEIISVKSCDNTIRYNTFRRSLGTLSLRHGDRSTVEGNYFFGEGKTDGTNGSGGVRVYGKDHKIINNYFHGLTGQKWDAAITITNGDVTNSSTSLSSHFLPENLVVAFNTLYNNKSNIEIGFDNNGNYNRAPINCSLVNNIVVDTLNPIVKSYSSSSLAGVKFYNNIMYPTGTSSVGITASPSEINTVNPLLMRPACTSPAVDCNFSKAYEVLRLSPTSPAIDAALGTYAYVSNDFEGHSRTGLKDIGADEFSNTPIAISALDERHVGPNAIGYDYAYDYNITLPVKLVAFDANYNNKIVELKWQTAQEVNMKAYEMEWSINGNEFAKIATVVSRNAVGNSVYNIQHTSPATGNNYYRLKLLEKDGKFIYSAIKRINTSRAVVNIFPNPAQSFIKVELTSGSVSEARIINTSGVVLIRKSNLINGINTIALNNLATGIYRLQIIQDGTNSNHTFTIVR